MGFQPKDSRAYFMLPQAPADCGYYVYGTPTGGAGQYAHPALLSVLFFVERAWQAQDARKFGIGNISKAGGPKFKPHKSHMNGLQVDIRAVRTDGKQCPVSYTHAEYDFDATKRLIALFRLHPDVKKINFNDSRIAGVRPFAGHNDHFHVEL